MKLGICISLDDIEKITDLDFSYIELNLSNIAQKSTEEYNLLRHEIAASTSLKPYAFNGLFPQGYRIIGEDINRNSLVSYLERAFQRAKELGGTIVVFGSGHTRKIPEGFPKEKANEQFEHFLLMLSKEAEKNNITVVLEPLRAEETNFINTVREGLEIVKKVNLPHIRLLADYYHMSCEREEMGIILKAGREYLKHCHIANPEGRVFPKESDKTDYSSLFNNLKKIGYEGGISIEAGTQNLREDASQSYLFLNSLL